LLTSICGTLLDLVFNPCFTGTTHWPADVPENCPSQTDLVVQSTSIENDVIISYSAQRA